jgi:hypothetical protein
VCRGHDTFADYMVTNGNRFIPDFEVIHTCRDYESLKVWANNRDSVDPERWQENTAKFRSSSKGGRPIP